MTDPKRLDIDIMGAAEFDELSVDERHEYLESAMAHLQKWFAEAARSLESRPLK